jgi:hypothetical protein
VIVALELEDEEDAPFARRPYTPDRPPETLPSARLSGAKPRRIYVAAASEDFARARAVIELLGVLGLEVTHDWTPEVEEHLHAPPREYEPGEPEEYARLDMEGVRSADVVLCLTPSKKRQGCGLYAELGMGVVLGKRVIVTGAHRGRCIFAALAETYATDLEGVMACQK